MKKVNSNINITVYEKIGGNKFDIKKGLNDIDDNVYNWNSIKRLFNLKQLYLINENPYEKEDKPTDGKLPSVDSIKEEPKEEVKDVKKKVTKK